MSLAIDAADELAGILAAALEVPVHATVPPVPVPPCVIVADGDAGDEWVTVERIGGPLSYRVGLRVWLVASAIDSTAARVTLGDLLDQVLTALPAAATVGPVKSIAPVDLGAQGVAYSTAVPVTLAVR